MKAELKLNKKQSTSIIILNMKDISENLLGQILLGIDLKKDKVFNPKDDALFLDEITFVFEKAKLQFLPDIDTDEIFINFSENGREKNPDSKTGIKFLDRLIGEKITFWWNGYNKQNYFDMFILSFDYLHPSLIILSEGSVLKLFETQIILNLSGKKEVKSKQT